MLGSMICDRVKKAAFFQGIGPNPLFAARDRWTLCLISKTLSLCQMGCTLYATIVWSTYRYVTFLKQRQQIAHLLDNSQAKRPLRTSHLIFTCSPYVTNLKISTNSPFKQLHTTYRSFHVTNHHIFNLSQLNVKNHHIAWHLLAFHIILANSSNSQ